MITIRCDVKILKFADAKFWVGRGQKPTASGIRIPDENGRETPLRKYDQKTIVLTLPGDLTVFDIGKCFFIYVFKCG